MTPMRSAATVQEMHQDQCTRSSSRAVACTRRSSSNSSESGALLAATSCFHYLLQSLVARNALGQFPHPVVRTLVHASYGVAGLTSAQLLSDVQYRRHDGFHFGWRARGPQMWLQSLGGGTQIKSGSKLQECFRNFPNFLCLGFLALYGFRR